MPRPRIFLSSTCYDLSRERTGLEKTIKDLFYTPVLSDKGNVHYDPDKSTHAGCLDEVENHADYVVGILSFRFGGAIFREAFKRHVNVDLLRSMGSYPEYFDEDPIFSITQCEILKAIELGIPHIICIQQDVLDERNKYEQFLKKSKNKLHLKSAYTPSQIAIFRFITFINHLHEGNATYPYSNIKQLQETVKNTLSMEFHALLTTRKKARSTQHNIISIPADHTALSTLMMGRLREEYRRQTGVHAIENRMIFDNKGNCHYYLTVRITPKSDYPLYYVAVTADKPLRKLDVIKFRNVTSGDGGKYVGFIYQGEGHLFLLNDNPDRRKPFTVELEMKIDNYLSDVPDKGKGELKKTVTDPNKKYSHVKWQMSFPKNTFKNLKMVCKDSPDKVSQGELITPSRSKEKISFHLNLDNKSLVYKKTPFIWLEITCDR